MPRGRGSSCVHGGRHKPQLAHLDMSEQCHEVEAALGRVNGGHFKPRLTHLVLSEQCHKVEAALGRIHGVAISLNRLTLFCLSNATRSRQLLAVSSLPMEVAIACLTTPLSSEFKINRTIKYSLNEKLT